MVSIIILALVVLLISIRRLGRYEIAMWQAMTLGAILVLITRQISFQQAILSINFEVIFFLLFMFILGSALELSGSLEYLAFKLFKKAKNVDLLILQMIFFFGILSSIFTNDTIAIVGTGLALILSRNHKIDTKLILLTVAFSVTIGSTLSPIGNPQNLIIAVEGSIPNPFLTFFKFNFIPMILNSFFAYLVLKFFFRKEFREEELIHEEVEIQDSSLAMITLISSIILVVLIIIKVIVAYLTPSNDFPLVYIAMVSAIPVIVLSKRRREILSEIDYKTLIFFVSMFILMESVFLSGAIQSTLDKLKLGSIGPLNILGVSVIISQLVSNVPASMILLPLVRNSVPHLWRLRQGQQSQGISQSWELHLT
ncbi:SLC13 family permease [Caldisericum exile]|uniref:SLC13 family permease n=1 Tax=Caldisericum exile TaxID=693075 RepID=UPI003C7164AD